MLGRRADFRLPEYRREVFHRFYEFHLENKSHPGCVYYALPWLISHLKLDEEGVLWLAYLNGNTQNIVTTYLIYKENPIPGRVSPDWFQSNYERFAWDTDRRYHKKFFLDAVNNYSSLTTYGQGGYFRDLCLGDEEENFNAVWKEVRKNFFTFGRLSTFSYLEYLRIAGLPLNCDQLFLEDMEGSKSHRNGLAKVLGRDDLDWHKSTDFRGDYTEDQIEWLKAEAALILEEARERTATNTAVDPKDVNYFTLESALCTYKSWHRPRRRYPNVYNDMFHERIKKAERVWDRRLDVFWQMREECVPEHLRLESNPNDPGLCPEKQDYYRLYGCPIMMSRRWPEFDNPFDQRCWS